MIVRLQRHSKRVSGVIDLRLERSRRRRARLNRVVVAVIEAFAYVPSDVPSAVGPPFEGDASDRENDE
jgi:hypothetical protein